MYYCPSADIANQFQAYLTILLHALYH